MSDEFVIGPYEEAEIMLIKAVTNLHPGVGRTGEIVDLPVQKDNFGFPIIYASSLKGALKSAFWSIDREQAKTFFGSDPEEEGEKFTSAIAILDAFVVAFPVRSLEGVYAFATSPLLLHRFSEYTKIAGKDFNFINELIELSINDDECYTSPDAQEKLKLNVEGMRDKLLINEEIMLGLNINKSEDIGKVEELFDIERGRLILLSNNVAERAIEKSLVRVTRIAIDREKKTVKVGALWTEEYVPWSTIFATTLLYSKTKQKRSEKVQGIQNAKEIKKEFYTLLREKLFYLIIGGNETTGRGIVKLSPLNIEDGR